MRSHGMKGATTLAKLLRVYCDDTVALGIAEDCLQPRVGSGWAIRAQHLLSRLDDRGATIVEFAMVGPMLLLLMMMIIDLGLMLTTQSLLDGAARDAARQIRTGQVHAAADPKTTFQNLLCSRLTPVMSAATCLSTVVFEVQVFASYTAVSFTPCTTVDSTQPGYCTFTNAAGTQIVGIQVSYDRSFIVPWVGACLTGGSCWFGAGTATGSNPGTNAVRLMSTVIIQNEPFPS
jgi:Flp pilus assembly protein TadG